MRKEITIAGLALAIALGGSSITASAGEHVFADAGTTPSWAWAEDEIYEAYEEGIIEGKEGNIFDAEGKVTRAEAATMLVKWKGISPEEYGDACEAFADVEADKWYTRYVNAAYENGLIAGKGEGVFDPEGYLTRAEAAALLVTGSGWLADATDVGFTDVPEAWYTSYINTAHVHGVMAGMGDGTCRPMDEVTRAQFVVMIESIWRDAEEAKEWYVEYTYDGNGKLLEETLYSEEGERIDTDVYIYDENGVLVQYKDNVLDWLYITEYFYDEQGRLVREVETNQEGESNGCVEYTYGAEGALVQIHDTAYDESYSIHEYDDQGRKKQITYYEKDGTLEYTLNYTYSEDGTVCTATKTKYGTTSQLWTCESLYDKAGNLQEERYSYTTGNNNRRTRYTYDEAGNMIQTAEYLINKEYGDIHIEEWYQYDYNATGQCIRWTAYTYDIMPTVA